MRATITGGSMRGTLWLCSGLACILAPGLGCVDAPVIDDGYQPAAPALPMPPVLTPCADGWREMQADRPGDPAWCNPWPAAGRMICAGAKAHFPGEAGCADVGPACPSGDWPADLPAGASIIYVQAGAAPGGTGAMDAPFAAIAAATAAAAAGTVIALAKGTYDEQVRLPGGVELWGACAAETAVVSDGTAGSGIIEIVGAGAAVRNLRVGPGARVGIAVNGVGRSVDIDGVYIDQATAAGIWVANEASASASDVLVRATRGDRGHALLVQSGGAATVARASFELSSGTAVYALGETGDARSPTIALHQVSIAGVVPSPAGGSGAGLGASLGGEIEGDAIAIALSSTYAVLIDDGSHGILQDISVTDVRTGFIAFLTTGGSSLELSRAHIAAASHQIVALEESHVTLADVVARASGTYDGVACVGGAMALQRVAATASRPFSFFDGCVGTAVDLTARGGAEILPNGDGAIAALRGAVLTLERAVIEDSASDGLRSTSGGTIVATDVTVRDLVGVELGPVGLLCAAGSTLDVERARVERITGVGVGAIAGATLRVTELHVGLITDRDCGGGVRCDGYGAGSGLASALEINRFRIVDNAVAGVILGPISDLDLDTGFIGNNPVGVNIQDPEFDPGRVEVDVVYAGNRIDLDYSDLPIPIR